MFGLFRKDKSDMILLAGLGNQGPKYQYNRHNIGFMAIDAIAASWGVSTFKSKYFGGFADHNQSGQKIGLLKTGTYMNESGKSLAAAAKFYKIPAENIIVFHDELDLEPGQVKIKKGGGNAGHNGLKSIEAHLGTKDYWRVRLGIGHPGHKDKVSSYVLNDFPKDDRAWLDPLLDDIGRYADMLVEKDMDAFIRKIKP